MMGIFVAIIWALIYIAVILMLAYVIIWAIGKLWSDAPSKVMTCIWVIAVLLCVLVLVGVLLPSLPMGPGLPGFETYPHR